MKSEKEAVRLLQEVDKILTSELKGGTYKVHEPGQLSSQTKQFCDIVLSHAQRAGGTLLTEVLQDPRARAELIYVFEWQQEAHQQASGSWRR